MNVGNLNILSGSEKFPSDVLSKGKSFKTSSFKRKRILGVLCVY